MSAHRFMVRPCDAHEVTPMCESHECVECVNATDFSALSARNVRLEAALRGMVAIHDSVTQGQERELRDEWLPKARAALKDTP